MKTEPSCQPTNRAKEYVMRSSGTGNTTRTLCSAARGIRTLVFSLLMLIAVPLPAATLLEAEAYVDVASGTLVRPAVLLIEKGRIAAINPEETPEDVERIKLADQILLPGLIDMHTHLVMDMAALPSDLRIAQVTLNDMDLAIMAAHNASKTLLAGFTTVRDLGGGGAAIAVQQAIHRNQAIGPDIFAARNSIGITGGHCDATGFNADVYDDLGYRDGVADGQAEVVKAVRYQIKHGARVIKLCVTAGVLSYDASVGAQQMSHAEIRAAVEEAARHGMKVAAHAHGSAGILAAVKAGVASIEHGSMLTPEIMREMKARGTYLVPTTHLADHLSPGKLPPPLQVKADKVIPQMVRSLEAAIAADVLIANGSDAAVMPHGENALEVIALTRRGMTNAQALQAATVNAARLLGVDDRGRIDVGLRADLVAVKSNPLEQIDALKSVSFVMKQGWVYKR